MARNVQAFAVLCALAFGPIALTDLRAQDFHFTGGAVKGIQVKTQTALAGGFSSTYAQLPGSDLTVHLNAGESDVFVYELAAECALIGGGDGDYLLVQARVNGALSSPLGAPLLQPQRRNEGLVLCSSAQAQAASMSWAIKLAGGSAGADYTLTVWWRVLDQYEPSNPGGSFGKRTVKITRYN